MSREDLIKLDGTVTEALSANRFTIKLGDGRSILAKLSGKIRRNHIKVVVGDKVTLGVSPYDHSHGLILTRERAQR